MRSRQGFAAVALGALLASGGCGTGGAPTPPAAAPAPAAHTEADVGFMQMMLHHHAQAIEMTSLVAERTSNPQILRLAERIDRSQADEMRVIREWLGARGLEGAEAHAGHDHHARGFAEHPEMPGMLTVAQMQRLAATRGAEFDRLFLESMIFHHEGAVVMVQELFAEGGGQESEIFSFASHVESDQQMEIMRMRTMLRALGN
jgi:uncharacterized protein (DUF305 family)